MPNFIVIQSNGGSSERKGSSPHLFEALEVNLDGERIFGGSNIVGDSLESLAEKMKSRLDGQSWAIRDSTADKPSNTATTFLGRDDYYKLLNLLDGIGS